MSRYIVENVYESDLLRQATNNLAYLQDKSTGKVITYSSINTLNPIKDILNQQQEEIDSLKRKLAKFYE